MAGKKNAVKVLIIIFISKLHLVILQGIGKFFFVAYKSKGKRQVKSSASQFHLKENVGATHE